MRSHVAAATVGLLAVTVAACGGGSETFAVEGNLILISEGATNLTYAREGASPGDDCEGAGLFAEARPGSEIVVYNGAGDRIAVGKLPQGVLPDGYSGMAELGIGSCLFAFSVPDVPVDGDVYSVDFGSGLDETTFSRDGAASLEISLSDG